MAYAEYMNRIAFLDGQVLHDFHLNIMQKNIAEAIKSKTTQERYDFYLLVSPYSAYYMEPFINTANRDSSSTATLNTLSFSISSGSWITPMLELPKETDEINLVANFEDYPNQGAYVRFYYRTTVDSDWISINVDKPVLFASPKRYIQIKAECSYAGTIRPTIYDFSLMWK